MSDRIVETLDPLGRVVMLAKALTAGLDAEEILDILVRQGMAGLGAEGGVLALLDAGFVTPVLTVGYRAEVVASYGRLGLELDLPLTAAARENTAIWISSRAEGLERYPKLASGASTAQAWATIPIVAGGATFGVLGVSFDQPRQFGQAERLLLQALVDVSAVALHSVFIAESQARQTREFGASAPEEFADSAFLALLHRVVLHEFATSMKLAAVVALADHEPEISRQLRATIEDLDTFTRSCQREALSRTRDEG